jgi:hypothetical protein
MKSDYYIVTFQTNSAPSLGIGKSAVPVTRWESGSQTAVIKRERRQSMRASESWQNFWIC